jgi:hypothetical protein
LIDDEQLSGSTVSSEAAAPINEMDPAGQPGSHYIELQQAIRRIQLRPVFATRIGVLATLLFPRHDLHLELLSGVRRRD